MDNASIQEIIKNSEKKLSQPDITDKDRYLLNYKIDTLKNIN